jgi:hypothetical protein
LLAAGIGLACGAGPIAGALGAQTVQPQAPSRLGVDSHLGILDTYLRGRREWLQTTPAVRICWPARDSLQIDEADVRALVAAGNATEVDPTCRTRDLPTPDALNIFEVTITHDTIRILAGRGLDICRGIEETSVLTRAPVPGVDIRPRHPSGKWVLREIVMRAPSGGDCVMITPRP